MPRSYFEFLGFQLRDTPRYRAIRDNAFRSADLFVARAGDVEAVFQEKLALVAPDGKLDEQAVLYWERNYISRLSGLRCTGDHTTHVIAPIRIANEIFSNQERYEMLRKTLSARKSATPDSIDRTTISHSSTDSPAEAITAAVRENAEAMAELFVRAFKKLGEMGKFDAHAADLDAFMQNVIKGTRAELEHERAWYYDRYREFSKKRQELCAEESAAITGLWQSTYAAKVAELKPAVEAHHAQLAHVLAARQTFSEVYNETHGDDVRDDEIGYVQPKPAAKTAHVEGRVPPLNLEHVHPVKIAGQDVFLLPVIEHAQKVATRVKEIYCNVFAATPSTTAHFDATVKDPKSLRNALQQVIRDGMGSTYIFVCAHNYFVREGFRRVPEMLQSLCHPKGAKPEVCAHLEAQWQEHYAEALAPIRAALIERGKLVDVPSHSVFSM